MGDGGFDADRFAVLTHLGADNQCGLNAFPEWEGKKSISASSNQISAWVIESSLFICFLTFIIRPLMVIHLASAKWPHLFLGGGGIGRWFNLHMSVTALLIFDTICGSSP